MASIKRCNKLKYRKQVKAGVFSLFNHWEIGMIIFRFLFLEAIILCGKKYNNLLENHIVRTEKEG